ncbi:hypothetical protein ADUPG1_007917 [Aduncisulcus paluster]|uniref:Uncharacterized protein n=1 Tax=Aduncisulcus paluster TaxID=2918883 RepID=A0ABQ5KQ16_9EUKA|nr:hypothetical protein ADUPG1_007917 [Aduncisulcus paluster]
MISTFFHKSTSNCTFIAHYFQFVASINWFSSPKKDTKNSSSASNLILTNLIPEYVLAGNPHFIPIPRDIPSIKNPDFHKIQARNTTLDETDIWYDQSSYAQDMMKGGYNFGQFTHISIPFSSSSPIKGAYICLFWLKYLELSYPSHLIFTFTSLEEEIISFKYEFLQFRDYNWFLLPIDLSDVVFCEITGKGCVTEFFKISSLVFFQEQSPEEMILREEIEKLWCRAPIVTPEFIKEGEIESIPISRKDPSIINPFFTMVMGKDDTYCKESKQYDQSVNVQEMLKGKDFVQLTYISIPFPPSHLKGAYICVYNDFFPSLLFTFTDCSGKKIYKKYELRPKHEYEWFFLPIDIMNIIMCEIEVKEIWEERYDVLVADYLSLLPWEDEEEDEENSE